MGKTRGMGAARKLKKPQKRPFKKSTKKPFASSSHAKEVVLEKIGIEATQSNSVNRECAGVQLLENVKKIAASVPSDGLNYI